MAETATSYDELPYNDRAFVHAHPDRLAVIGALHGLRPAPPDRCRVLELGCGLGGNLLPMAAALPDSRFVGIDLSARQIEQGRAVARRLGLGNVELRQQDLADFDPGEGAFDYVLCHGVYSWVPPIVQERILSACRRGLAPHGLAMISYNAYPGWRANAAVRDVLRHGARGADAPGEQVARGLEFLGFVARNLFDADSPYARTVRAAAEHLAAEDPTYVFHEYLEEHNHPAHVEEFARLAARSGLRYVAEAALRDPSNQLTDEARPLLTGIADDLVRCEQTLDYLRGRTFRRDVLCHEGAPVQRWPQPAALKDMLLVALAEPASPRPKAAPGAVEQFRAAKGQKLSTSDAALKAALRALHAARPRAVPYAELLGRVKASVRQVDEARLARSLLACATASLAEVHAYLPPIAARPGDRPHATAVARWQAGEGRLVVDLRHRSHELDDLTRAVLAMLDGTRDRRALCDELQAQLRAGRLTLRDARGRAVKAMPPGQVQRTNDEVLDALADLRLLTE